MKTYMVVRTPDGDVMAFVDGEPLFHVVAHSPDGFSLGRGPGADDLALSILADHIGERPTMEQIMNGQSAALTHHQDFKWAFLTPAADGTPLRITAAEINQWLAEQ